MPAVDSNSKVLVTGASGFIAAWVVKTLLEHGFRVRGTVRSASKGDYLVNLFKTHPGRFEYVVVEDIALPGAFDHAVEGVDAVEHTASPFHYKAGDPDELIVPALKGTIGILESIRTHGASVRRVVVTSSVAAVIHPADHQLTLTEKDWNDFSIQQVKAKGNEASPLDKYRASKTLAERAAWEFVEKHKDEIQWDMVALNPPFVLGPSIHEMHTVSSLNTSLALFYPIIKGESVASSKPEGNWVDVRDLACAHVNAITTEKAGGERFLIGSGPYTFQDLLDAVHAGSASDPMLSALPKGIPGAGKSATHPVLLDTTKARTILGLTFKELDECGKDTARSLLEREKALGW